LSILILVTVTLANGALSALVLLRSHKALANRLFALVALSAAGWTGTNALFQSTDSVAVAMLAAQASSASSLLMSASFLHFSWVYPLRTPGSRVRLWLLWTTTLLLALLSFIPGAVDRSVELTGTHRIITAPGFYLVALFLLLTTGAAFTGFVRHTLTLHGSLREQALYVMLGAGVTAIFGTIFNVAFPLFGDYRFVWLGPSFSVFFVGGAVYSIIAHHLFDIRLIIKRAVVYSLLLAGISGGYSAVEYLLTELFTSASPEAASPLAAHIIGAVMVSLCVNPVRKWLERKIHRLLYPKHSKRAIRNPAPLGAGGGGR
jgi:hypothetical protein